MPKEARVISDRETMTYSYYFENVKPKPQTEGKKGYVCKICGYVYEGDTLPEDFICPLCKHPASYSQPQASQTYFFIKTPPNFTCIIIA